MSDEPRVKVTLKDKDLAAKPEVKAWLDAVNKELEELIKKQYQRQLNMMIYGTHIESVPNPPKDVPNDPS